MPEAKSGRELNGRTLEALDKAVATQEGAHSAVICEGLFRTDSGKDRTFAKVPTDSVNYHTP